MTDWIEVPKPAKGSALLKPDAVRFGVRRPPLKRAQKSAYMAISIGGDIVRKLGWTKDTKLRMRWAADGSRMRIDEAPPNHPHVYKLTVSPRHGSGRFFSAAMPSMWTGDEIAPASVPVEVVIDRAVGQRPLDSIILTLPREFWSVPKAKTKAA